MDFEGFRGVRWMRHEPKSEAISTHPENAKIKAPFTILSRHVQKSSDCTIGQLLNCLLPRFLKLKKPTSPSTGTSLWTSRSLARSLARSLSLSLSLPRSRSKVPLLRTCESILSNRLAKSPSSHAELTATFSRHTYICIAYTLFIDFGRVCLLSV